jgi:tetratricopeptide (TPR) repeat protein
LLADQDFGRLIGATSHEVTGVGPQFRLAITPETSVALAPPYRAPTVRLGREPVRLLLPEYGIVPFTGRGGDLQELQAWCLDGVGPALRVVVGMGGSGKTRLAAEACVRMMGKGWQVGFADPDAPGGQVQLEFDRPTLLVVDDADLKVELLADLIRAVGYWSADAPPVRLLLLARHTTGWWDKLNQRTDHLAAELADSELTLHDGSLASAARAEHHMRALTAFAGQVTEASAPVDQPPPVLDDPAFANPLVVHMHALLTVCAAWIPTIGSAVRERILDAVLDRERRRWAQTLPSSLPTGGARMRQQAVTAATLLAPPTETDTARTMAVIDELASDAAAGARAAVATWLRELYPGSDPPWVAPLRPDLLAEQLLATCVQLTDIVLAGFASINAPEQIEQLLTELTRAEVRLPVHGALNRLLETHLADMLTVAIQAPIGRLPELLDLALTCCPQPDAAAVLVDRIPGRSTGLGVLAATLTSQAVDEYRRLAEEDPQTFNPLLATSLDHLSSRLAGLGRREDALTAAKQAVAIRQQPPGAFTRDLAVSLDQLAARLGELGYYQEALDAAEQAVIFHRLLSQASPDPLNPHLAAALNNQARWLAERGQYEKARIALAEAVVIFRWLGGDRPDTSPPYPPNPNLSRALVHLSNVLAALGEREEALAAATEAAESFYRLADEQPDVFNPELARALNHQARELAALRRYPDAQDRIEKAVALRRQLADARPSAFTPDLAASLRVLSDVLAGQGQHDEALVAAKQALALHRQLADARPGVFNCDLAGSLTIYGNRLKELDRHRDALTAHCEALVLYRSLYTQHPSAFRRALMNALQNVGGILRSLNLSDEAGKVEQEYIALRNEP